MNNNLDMQVKQPAMPRRRKRAVKLPLEARQTTHAHRLVMIAAGIAALFSLNALAANTSLPGSAVPAAGQVSEGDHNPTIQQRIERMKSMTPEQRVQERESILHELKNLPPEQRDEQRKAIREQFESMSPEERRYEMREHWKNMSPEEREQFREKLQERWRNMSPEEREKRRQDMLDHFNNMSPEERQQFKLDMGTRNDMPPSAGSSPGTGDASHAGKP